ncbi:hypothetical protein MAR_000177 [Mya arenaria]|uniref:Endonuclease/exonuclease/phosphatase domain-containing protein n=1 Tax=Mya arenaria TaxID=6604 RepID=A0ABY7FB10_MYAAR|nr:hypothetical protein MAR_000177 [Mya arenaria]
MFTESGIKLSVRKCFTLLSGSPIRLNIYKKRIVRMNPKLFLWAKSWKGNITWNNVVENSLYNDEHGRIISLEQISRNARIINILIKHLNYHVIRGDFNCTFDKSLDRKGAATPEVKSDEGCQELKAFAIKNNLEHVWSRRNQGIKCFNFIRNSALSRIDTFPSLKSIDDEIEQCKIVSFFY